VLAGNLATFTEVLLAHGATAEELEAELALARANIAVYLAQFRADLRAWLERGGEVLN